MIGIADTQQSGLLRRFASGRRIFHGNRLAGDLSQFNMYLSVPQIAQKVILLCDYTKFDYQSAHRLGAVQDIADTIITNQEVDPEYPREMEKLGINFIMV